jgi:alkylhydroperoxidase/carboxymuconolactone decarboxylase family protein YurZ
MPYVRTVPIDAADGLLAETYDRELAKDGYVANMTQLFSLRPEVYAAWGQLRDSIRGNMDLRRYELATLAAARALRCRQLRRGPRVDPRIEVLRSSPAGGDHA